MQHSPAGRGRPWLLAALVLGLVAAAGCRDRKPAVLGGDGGRRPNVLLITIDTLRADHLGAYGYPLPTSPAVDRLAREGVTFENAFTPVPTTAPAIASLLTGSYVDTHHVWENAAELPSATYTLGAAFRSAGYGTAGFYGNGAIAKGFGQGLQVWQPFDRRWNASDEAGADRALSWLATAQPPWFLWVHFMDPHGPYTSPAERTASFRYPDTQQLRRRLEVSPANWGFGVIPRYQALPGATRVGDYVRRYDGEIVGTDEQIGRLISHLEQNGLLDDTLVVVTADHGESLGEDDYFFQHGKLLNEASLRVPLVLRHPDLPQGKRIAAQASLVDLLPTLTALVGISLPGPVEGIDLRPVLAGQDLRTRDLVAYTVTRPTAAAIRRGDWKLVGFPGSLADGRPASIKAIGLYATRGGEETRVRVADNAELVRALQPELQELAGDLSRVRAKPLVLDDEQRARLRALGYVE